MSQKTVISCDSHKLLNPIPYYQVDKPLAPNNGVFLEALGISLAASPSFPDITTRNFAEGKLSYFICSPTSQDVRAKIVGQPMVAGLAGLVAATVAAILKSSRTAVTSGYRVDTWCMGTGYGC